MNLHLLRLFTAVARERSFSRAAEALRISQPAVSKGVREFEDQLGGPLFERRAGGVELNEAGRTLMRHATVLFEAERAGEEALADLRGLHCGTLRIGASTTIAAYFLPSVLGSFTRAHPQIDLRLTSANTAAIVDLLFNRQLDVALVEGPIAVDSILVKPWRQDELVCVVSAEHPLATHNRPIAPKALADQTIILREQGSGTRDVAWDALQNSGLTPLRILEVSDNEAITRVVAAGLGIGIVSSVVAEDQIALGRVVRIEIRGLSIRRTLSRLFLVGRQPSASTVAFDLLLDHA